jgi:hypothetical protein
MPKREPGHQHSGEPLGGKVKMRLVDGRWVPVREPAETVATSEAAERPPTPDDPRPPAFRQIPPFGGA